MFGFIRNLFGVVVEGRSSQWPKVRAAHLKVQPECQWCGTTEGVEVHHVVPVHRVKELELDPTNLISLCGHDHLAVGHLMNWLSWNVSVRDDCYRWQLKRKNRP